MCSVLLCNLIGVAVKLLHCSGEATALQYAIYYNVAKYISHSE
jgi:hypothetical protein